MNGNTGTIRAWYEAFGRGDLDGARRFFQPDCVFNIAAGFPQGGAHLGAEHVLFDYYPALGAELARHFDGWALNPDRLIEAEDGTVVSIGRYTATARATGEALAVPFVHTWEFRDGRIAATTQYTDTWLVRTAMGAGSPSGAVG